MFTISRCEVEHWRYRLERPVGGTGVSSVDLVVAEIVDAEGLIGLGFSYVLGTTGEVAARAARSLAEKFLAPGTAVDHPLAVWRRMTASFNRTGRGPNYTGLGALDLALWDLYAKVLDQPLGLAMGGAPRPVPVYGSGGFTAAQDPAEAVETARAYVDRKVLGVKPRAAGRPRDEAVLSAVADAVPEHVHVMCDANEKCSIAQAQWLLGAAAELGVYWVEEPLPAYDLAAHRALSRRSTVTIATGEHLRGAAEAAPYITEGLAGVIQPDLGAMGWTECWRVAQLAEFHNVEVSPHFLPGLFIHLAAACPNVTWLEDFPILEPLFVAQPVWDETGQMTLPGAPGHGLTLTDGARDAFRLAG